MSSLYKLQISGVRSFSPKENETIQFGAPLTLICGQNGCGKTTIIESLKYATTGDLPPNSKGGAFINDPSIADRSVVNAEIKLGFISVDGKSMTVTRNMQLNRKKGRAGAAAGNTFKSLEGQLAVIRQGQKNSISTKNLELDTRVPLYLGASKAVLEYVIFCHQDESLWPLSEAGVLKKRFDEIFEAAKFTKVLDNLKSIRKDLAQDIKLIQGNVAHFAQDKGRAAKLREKLHDSIARVDQYSVQIADLVVEIEDLEKRADALFHSNQTFQKTLSDHERLRLTIQAAEVARSRLLSSVQLLPDTDEALSHMAAHFDATTAEKRRSLAEKEASGTEFAAELERLRGRSQVLSRTEGLLSSKAEDFAQKQQWLSQMATVDEAAVEHSEAAVREFVSKETGILDRESEECRSLEGQVAGKKESMAFVARELQEKHQKMAELREKIAALAVPEETIEIETSQLENLRARLENKRQTAKGPSNAEIEQKKQQVRTLESDLDELMCKINSANKMADLTSRMTLLKESRSEKSAVVDRLVSSYQQRFSESTGADLASQDAEKLMDSVQRELVKKSQGFRHQIEKLRGQFDEARSSLQYAEKQKLAQQKRKEMLRANIGKVISDTEIPQYETLVQEMEEDYKNAVYNLNTYDVTKSYKSKAMEIARTAKCCALCSRNFAENELVAFLDATDQNIKSLTADKLTEDVKEIFNELQELKSINVDVLEYRRLNSQQEADFGELQASFDGKKALVQEAEGQLQSVEQKLDQVAALAKPVAQIVRTREEVAALDQQLQFLETESSDHLGSVHTMEELQSAHQQKSFEVKNLRQAISDSIDERISIQKELSNLEAQMKDKQLSISKAQLSLNEVRAINSSMQELKVQAQGFDSQKQVIGGEIREMEASLQEKKALLSAKEAGYQKRKQQLEEAASKARNAFQEQQKLSAEVKQFIEEEQPKMQQNSREVAETKAEMEQVSQKIALIGQEIAEINKFLSDTASTQRNIRDNMEYRQSGEELDRLQRQMSEIDIVGAEKAKNEYQQRSQELRHQIAELNSQHYGKVGEVKQINDQISSLQKDLQEEFKDVDQKYHSEWLKLQSNMLVSNDILTYSQAMDNAIMQYHSMKMNEINRILRELWSQTYKGTDIDGIEIKCDVTHTTSARGRSYNYRVVMYKKNSELDMRGRCSAGQKVLTSILIRLALAECFGTNCGMIALDEPTTNLDTENAESLANALNNIIDFRKSQKNFQLIIITHDEKFLGHINGDSYTDNFYRIERDENQHSVIRSLPIHLMQEN